MIANAPNKFGWFLVRVFLTVVFFPLCWLFLTIRDSYNRLSEAVDFIWLIWTLPAESAIKKLNKARQG